MKIVTVRLGGVIIQRVTFTLGGVIMTESHCYTEGVLIKKVTVTLRG